MRLGKTTLIHFGSQVVISVSGFVATLVIARWLGSATLGLYATTVALLFWMSLPINATGQAIKKRVSEGVDRARYLGAGAFLLAAIVSTLSVIILATDAWINAYVGSTVSDFLILLIINQGVYNFVVTGLNGQKKVGYAGVIQAANQLVRTVLQVSLVLIGYELGGLLTGHFIAFGVAAIIGLYRFEIWPTLPRREHFHSLYRYVRYSWLGTLKTRAFGWMDTIVLAFFVSPGLIGIYEVAWSLASVLALISLSVGQVLFPEISELSVENDYERIHHYLEEGLVFAGIFAIPGLVGAAILGSRVLRIYSQEFQQGATILVILIVARTVAAFGGQFLNTINAVDRPDIAFRINAAFVLANVVLNVGLVWLFGWYGAALATALSATLLLVLGYRSLVSLIGSPSLPIEEILRETIAAGVMGVIVFSLDRIAPIGNFVTIGLVFTGATVYLICLLAMSSRIRSKAIMLMGNV